MNRIRKVSEGMNVQPLFEALQAHPELWDQTPHRTAPTHSPHHGLSDIFIRYSQKDPLDAGPHESVWYPAADVLPVKALIFQLMHDVHGVRLGVVVITKFRAGQLWMAHRDGGWLSGYYVKFVILVESGRG